MRVVAADSASTILDAQYRPRVLLAVAAVVAEPPYLEPSLVAAKPLFKPVGDRGVVLEELKLCLELASSKPEEIHIDVTAGGLDLTKVGAEEVLARLSTRSREALMEVVPSMIGELKARGIEVPCLLIGKESLPVRLAELTAGAYGVSYACIEALREGSAVKVGLPRASSLKVDEGKVWLQSLLPSEEGVKGASVLIECLDEVQLTEHPNPVAAGFKVVELRPKR